MTAYMRRSTGLATPSDHPTLMGLSTERGEERAIVDIAKRL